MATTAATEAVDAMDSVADIIGAKYATQEYVDSKNWVKRDFVSGEDLNEVADPGLYTMRTYTIANSLLNKPTGLNVVDRGVTEVLAGGGAVQQTWYPMGVASRTEMPIVRRRRDDGGVWTEWEQINAFTPAKETYLMESIAAAKPLVGTGSPEGEVAAPVGSVYIDTAATNGSIRWVKASGTGSTGWRDDYGDTIDALEAKADKSEVADARWWKTPTLANSTNFDEVRDPSIRIMLGGTHESAPFNALGTLEVLPTGYNGVIQRATHWGTLEVWKRRTQGGVFQAWAKEPTLADINAVKTLIPSVEHIQNLIDEALGNIDIPDTTTDWTRRAPLAVTTGAGPSEGPGSGRYRMKVQFTAPIIRWRLHISTAYTLGGTPGSESTLWLVRVGNHTGDAAMGQAVELMSGSAKVPEGGEWVSGWTNHRLDTESIIDVSFTASGSTRNFLAPAWKLDGKSWVQTNRAPLWVWIEAETYKDTPTVALIGDSTGAGHGSITPVWDSAAAIAGRKQEFLPVLFASSGDTLAGNVSINDPNFVRWSDYGTYDSVVIQAGSNDINSGKTLAEVQASFTSVAAVAKELGVKVYGATIKPRYPTDTSPDVRAPYNEWLKTLPAGISGVIDYDGAVAPDGVILPEDNDDGSHLKSSGHHKMATAYSFPIARPRVVGVWKS